MAGIEFIQHFLQQASAQGSKSTSLNPLGWLVAILSAAFTSSFLAGAPSWASVMLGVTVTLAVVAYLVAYIYFMLKNPDYLRSEKFSLSKMAIEKSVHGDNISGLTSNNVDSSITEPVPAVDLFEEGDDGN